MKSFQSILLIFNCIFVLIDCAAIPASESEREYHQCLVNFLESENVRTTFAQDETLDCSEYHKLIDETLTSIYKDVEENLYEALTNQTEIECLIESFKENKFLEINIILTSAFMTSANFHRDQLNLVFEESQRIFIFGTIQCLMTENMLVEIFDDFARKVNVTDDEFVCVENHLQVLDFKKIDDDEKKFKAEEKVNETIQKLETESSNYDEKNVKEIDYDEVASEVTEKFDDMMTESIANTEQNSEIVTEVAEVSGKTGEAVMEITEKSTTSNENFSEVTEKTENFDIEFTEKAHTTGKYDDSSMESAENTKIDFDYDDVVTDSSEIDGINNEITEKFQDYEENSTHLEVQNTEESTNDEATTELLTESMESTEISTNIPILSRLPNARYFDLADLEAAQSEIYTNTIKKISPQDSSAEVEDCHDTLSNLNSRISSYEYPSLNEKQNNCMRTKLTTDSINAAYRFIALNKLSATDDEIENRNKNLADLLFNTIWNIIECTDVLNIADIIENLLPKIHAENAE